MDLDKIKGKWWLFAIWQGSQTLVQCSRVKLQALRTLLTILCAGWPNLKCHKTALLGSCNADDIHGTLVARLVLPKSLLPSESWYLLYNFHVCEYDSIFIFICNQSYHLRSTSYGALLGRIFFYGKIEHFVEVFANDFQTIL